MFDQKNQSQQALPLSSRFCGVIDVADVLQTTIHWLDSTAVNLQYFYVIHRTSARCRSVYTHRKILCHLLPLCISQA